MFCVHLCCLQFARRQIDADRSRTIDFEEFRALVERWESLGGAEGHEALAGAEK